MTSADLPLSHDPAGGAGAAGTTAATPAAPMVTAVVVAKDPGPWFEEVLGSFAAQDYPRLSIEVVDPASEEPVADRVHRLLPDATVRRLDKDPGYSGAVNTVLDGADRPAFVAVCHDDVALAPDAIRLLVEEAVRSNAGIVGPKLVDWDQPQRLLAVGVGVDKTAAVAPYVERGELDQEQHDGVRDVFAISGGVTVVRTDLLRALGGLDATMSLVGEDVDLCWRAHAAGARVVVVPSAVVRHRAGIDQRRLRPVADRLGRRHQVRTLLSGYGLVHSVRVVPQAIVAGLVELVAAVVTGRFSHARNIVGSWTWNLSRAGSILVKRRRLRSARNLPDGELRRFQVPGFAPLTAVLRGRGEAGTMTGWGRGLMDSLRSGPARSTGVVWAVALIVLVFGSRHLLTRGVPAVGELVGVGGAGELVGTWWRGWHPTGLGEAAPASPAAALLGVGSTILVGASGLLRTLLIVGMLPLGALGMWRLTHTFASRWTRLGALVAYLLVPVPYNALETGSWTALLAYGSLPWVLHRLGRAAAMDPFDTSEIWRPAWAEVLAAALVLAAAAALAPGVLVAAAILVVGVVVGSFVAGDPVGVGRFAVSSLGLVVAVVALLAPWSVVAIVDGPGAELVLGSRPDAGSGLDAASLVRFHTATMGSQPLGWALLVAAAVSLVLARGPRLGWAVRGWCIYLVSVAAALAGSRYWLGVGLPRPEVLLAPGALGLALAVAMGAAAVERDLRNYGFGWRQLVPVTAVVALGVAVLPVLVTSFDGRWNQADTDLRRVLSFMDAESPAGTARVLWIGHDDAIGAGTWALDDSLAYAITGTPAPGVLDRVPAVDAGAARLVADAVLLSREGGTSRLGSLLATFGIRYVVLPERLAPPPAPRLAESIDPATLASFEEQLDLVEVELGTPDLVVYRNDAWQPVVIAGEPGTFSGATLRDAAARAETTEPEPALELVGSPDRWAGTLTGGTEVYVAVAFSDRWSLEVDGNRGVRFEALGWATGFATATTGEARLSYESPLGLRMLAVGQLLLWVLAVVAVGLAVLDDDIDELAEFDDETAVGV